MAPQVSKRITVSKHSHTVWRSQLWSFKWCGVFRSVWGEEWGREAEGKGLQEQVKCRVCLVWGCLGERGAVGLFYYFRGEVENVGEGWRMLHEEHFGRARGSKNQAALTCCSEWGGKLVLWVLLPSLQLECWRRNWTRYRRQKNAFFTVDAIGPKCPCAPWGGNPAWCAFGDGSCTSLSLHLCCAFVRHGFL